MLDRYVKICHPFKYERLCTKLTVAGLIAWGWIISVVFGMLMYVDNHYHPSLGSNMAELIDPPIIYSFLGYTSMLSLVFVYVTTVLLKTVLRHRKQIQTTEGSIQTDKHQMKRANIFGLMALFLFLSYAPAFVYVLLSLWLDTNSNAVKTYAMICAAAMWGNNMINPVIFCWKDSKMRYHMKKILGRCQANRQTMVSSITD